MGAAVSVSVDASRAIAHMRGLTVKLQKQIMRKAMRTSGNMARSALRKAAPKGPTGNLRKSVYARPFTRGNAVGITVGFTAPHQHLVEGGTKPRYRKGKGRLRRIFGVKGGYTGVMPANPFFERKMQSLDPKIRASLEDKIVSEVKKVSG